MKYKYLLIILLFWFAICVYLFQVIYDNARDKAISELNSRQMIHARQAQRGIEDFFNDRIESLRKIAESGHVIKMDMYGIRELDITLENNPGAMTAITRVDQNGRIVYTTPYYKDVIGKDISSQKHVQKLLDTHKPVMSDVFKAVQGYRAVALHVPVFKEGTFNGSIGILIDFLVLSRRYLEEIRLGETGYAWMTSAEGIELYCPVPGHTGKSVFETCEKFPTILKMAERMVRGEQGVTTYIFDRIRGQKTETVKKHAVYLPIRMADTFWTIVVATSEEEVLATLMGFRNRLGLLIALFFFGSIVFSIYGMKAWGIVRAEEERKKGAVALEESRAFLERVIGLSPISMWISDKSGTIIRTNQSLRQALRLSDDQIVGKYNVLQDRNLVDQGVMTQVQAVFETLEPARFRLDWAAGKAGGVDFTGARNVVIDVSMFPIVDNQGSLTNVVCQWVDITERKRLEKRIQQAQKMESIGSLAGGIAHDFNNLLYPIIGLAELLLEDLPSDSREHENAQEIFNAGIRGSELVKQILAFSRQSEHKLIPVRIQQVLEEVLKLCRSTIPSDIGIIPSIAGDCGLVMADPTQIHQVAMNLITNAFHAVESNGGQILVELKEAALDVEDLMDTGLVPGRFAILTISDNGSGMEPDVQERIFEPYFTTKETGKGTGLGLAVAYGIIQEHGGEIKVFSEAKKGAAFRVYLPLMKQVIETEPMKKDHIYQTGDERVLLVDDEEPIIRLERQMLERLGYKVTTRASSLDALDAFRAKPDGFDLVITDFSMPNMTGDQLAREIMAIQPDIPVILCTGFSERINRKNAKAMGVKGFLMKPIVKSEMAKMVRDVLDDG